MVFLDGDDDEGEFEDDDEMLAMLNGEDNGFLDDEEAGMDVAPLRARRARTVQQLRPRRAAGSGSPRM